MMARHEMQGSPDAVTYSSAIAPYQMEAPVRGVVWTEITCRSPAAAGRRCGLFTSKQKISFRMLVELETIQRAQSGDEAAFNQIVQAYRKRILGTVYRLIGHPGDVEDVSQDVFVRLYHSLSQLRSLEVFERWLHRLTVNTTYDYLRKKRRSTAITMADLSDEQLVVADAVEGGKQHGVELRQQEARATVQALLGRISEEDRILLLLREVEGLSLKELNEIYDIKENALKVRLFRARKRALKELERLRADGEI